MGGQVRHVVWDWNGTLVDDFEVIVSATNAACSQVVGRSVSAAEYRAHFTRPVHKFYERLLGRPVTPDEWDDMNAAFHRSYLELRASCALAPDADAALTAVTASGRTQSLLSLWTHEELVKVVAEVGLAEHFLRLDGMRGLSDGGPKDRHLRDHLERMADDLGRDLDPKQILLIGDSLDDAAAAAAVGARCVLVEGGSHDAADLAASGDPVASSLLGALRAGGVLG